MFLIRNPDNACIIDGRQDEDHVDNLSKARGKRLKKDFSDSLTEAHVSFYANALTLFTNYNQFCRDWIRLLTWWNPFSYSRCVGWCHRISFRKGLLFAVVLCLYWGEGWNPTTKPIWGRWYNYNRKKQGTWSSAGLLSRFKYVLKNVLQKMLVVEGFWKNTDWIYFCNQGKANRSMTRCISSINMKKYGNFWNTSKTSHPKNLLISRQLVTRNFIQIKPYWRNTTMERNNTSWILLGISCRNWNLQLVAATDLDNVLKLLQSF